MSLTLSASNLSQLSASVRRPRYDRSAVTPGLVHLSVGGFFRAHQAVYADDLFENGGDPRWGYCGVGLLPQDQRMRDVLRSQGGLYTVVERNGDRDEARIVGSLVDYLFAPENSEAVIERLASDETKIVSMTITEGGYYISGATGEFDVEHPDIRHDLEHPHAPRCTFGYLAAALERRRLRGGAPVTLMSCDNIQGNGNTLKKHLLAFAELRDPKLAKWIEAHCAFPNSMVDRITPTTTDEDRALVLQKFGIEDGWPVMTESFRQWVLEDHFVAGRPAWEKCGVQLTADVAPYEKIKLRLLNGSHQALCYAGALMGYTYVHEAIRDPEVQTMVSLFMEQEVSPLLPSVPGIDLAAYKKELIRRFSNPAIRDQLSRIGIYGSSGIPKFVLPSLQEQLERGGSIAFLSFVIAAWFRYLAGRDESGRALTLRDPMAPRLTKIAQEAHLDPSAIFQCTDIFGVQLTGSDRFRQSVIAAFASLQTHGTRETLRRQISQSA